MNSKRILSALVSRKQLLNSPRGRTLSTINHAFETCQNFDLRPRNKKTFFFVRYSCFIKYIASRFSIHGAGSTHLGAYVFEEQWKQQGLGVTRNIHFVFNDIARLSETAVDALCTII